MALTHFLLMYHYGTCEQHHVVVISFVWSSLWRLEGYFGPEGWFGCADPIIHQGRMGKDWTTIYVETGEFTGVFEIRQQSWNNCFWLSCTFMSFQDNLLRLKYSTFYLISWGFFYLLFEFLNLPRFTLYFCLSSVYKVNELTTIKWILTNSPLFWQ